MVQREKVKGKEFPYWLAAIVVIGVGFAIYIATSDVYALIFNTLYKGALTTIFVTFVSFILASILGLIVALGGFSRHRAVRECARFYVEVVRGIPVLVLLFYIAFVGAPAMIFGLNWLLQAPIENGWISGISVRDFDLMWRAIFALMISYSAYIAEVFRAGIQAIDEGQIEAASALGLTKRQIFVFIIFPQAMRTILPPLGNDFISMIKDSALVSVLGVADITQLGKIYASGTFRFFETYNVVTFIYLLMTIGLSLVIRRFEKQLRQKQENKSS